MDALVMCGGRGTRLDADVEKPLYEIRDGAMIDRVCHALAASAVDAVYAAVSPATPATGERVRERDDCTVVETPGDGYVADLTTAIDVMRSSRPVVTCAADLPLLAPELVDRVVADATASDAASVTVAVPTALKETLGVSVDTTFEHGERSVAPTGLNVVGDGEDAVVLSYDARLAVNVNRIEDASVAARLCPPSDV